MEKCLQGKRLMGAMMALKTLKGANFNWQYDLYKPCKKHTLLLAMALTKSPGKQME